MPSSFPHEGAPNVSPTFPPRSVDTVRALCHDLRQPLAAIRLLAGAHGGNIGRRFDGIIEEARWLSEMVESVIGGAADDVPGSVDIGDLVAHCVHRAQPTATCHIGFFTINRAMAVVSPVAMSRALGCVLDNAVRAAGPGGQVTVGVTGTGSEITIRVIDDGPGLGHVPTNNSLGLTITRALVLVCGGAFELKAGPAGGAVAEIVLPAIRRRALSL